jgi:uncharacterized membrane protein
VLQCERGNDFEAAPIARGPLSVILCILIAAVAKTWKYTIIMAIIVGLLGSAFVGWLDWQDTHYGTSPPVKYMAYYIALGTTGFLFETAAFFAVKLGFRSWRRRRAERKPDASKAA